MSSRIFPFILHSAAAAAMIAAYTAPLPFHAIFGEQYGGMSQFLTIHGLFAAIITMSFGVLSDLFPRVGPFRAIKRSLMIVAMPVSAVVSFVYWSLLLFVPDLIMPKDLGVENAEPSSLDAMPNEDFHIPLHIDIGMHALPGIALVLDFLFLEKNYSQKTVKYYAPAVAITATTLYTSWAEYCANINGRFPYPFLNNPLEIRLAIYLGATGIAYGSFRALTALHR